MKLGLMLGYSGAKLDIPLERVKLAERLGFDSVWTAEAYGNDAVVPASFIAAQTSKIRVGTAIMQMPGRTPAMTAMTAMSLDALSGGRFTLGLGPSGPQVVEGWHGVPYGKPLTRTREYISIVRSILRREAPLEHEGAHYQIPFSGDGATGQGKAIKSILHGRADMKIFTAAISPNGLRCAGEAADGVFPVWMDPSQPKILEEPIAAGIAKAGGGKQRSDFELSSFVNVVLGDDVEKCRGPVKMMLALYIGGMGSREKNFYNAYAKRLGYEDAAVKIQDLYLTGKKGEAMAAVPDELIDAVSLVGPRERIAERVDVWKESGVDAMLLGTAQPEAIQLMAELVL